MNEPLVSIVIPTFNSERFLNQCLWSIKNQNYERVEIIVVDNFSSDRTFDIAETFEARIIKVKAGRSVARNIGAENAKGTLVLFMDADMELSYSVVEECVEASIKGFDAVIIPEYSSGNSFWAKCKALEKSCYINDDVMEAARFFRRIVFDSVGGYVPSLEACEDWDLSNRIRHLGFRITRIAALIKHNEGELSLSRSFLKKHYYGKALKSYYRLHPGQEPHSLNVFRLTFIRNLEKLASNPLCATGMLFMKFLELVALLIGRWSA